MYKVKVTFKDGSEKLYKCKKSPKLDALRCLPWVMFEKFPTLLDKRDWAMSLEQIGHHLYKVASVKIAAYQMDGRKPAIKSLKWFSWPDVFETAVAAAQN